MQISSHVGSVSLDHRYMHDKHGGRPATGLLITQEQAVRIAVAQDRSTRRRTGLVGRLVKALGR